MKNLKINMMLLHSVATLTDKDAGQLFKALRNFALTNKIPDNLSDKVNAIITPFLNDIAGELINYEKRQNINKNNGIKGGRPKLNDKKNIVEAENKLINTKPEFIFNEFSTKLTAELNEFIEFRKKIKKPIKTQRGFDFLQNSVCKLSNSDIDTAKKIIEQSINKEWLGFFALIEEKTTKIDDFNTNLIKLSKL